MVRVLALVEGRTEETFVNRILQPALSPANVWVIPVVLTTKRLASGAKVRGGVSVWRKIERDLRNLLGDTDAVAITTILDFYAFPEDAPGMDMLPAGTPSEKVRHVENQIYSHFEHPRLKPYLSLHELEALVLSDPQVIAHHCGDDSIRERLARTVHHYGGPEMVNDHHPPSRQIEAECPEYQKTLHGPLIMEDIGIDSLCQECPHFGEWFTWLSGL